MFLAPMRWPHAGASGWHDEGCALAVLGADRAEDIGGDRSLIFGSYAWARAALGSTLIVLPAPYDRRELVGEDRREQRQVARAIVRRSKPIAYCRLAFGQTVEVAWS